jgi:hypothetical protein
VKKPRFYLDIHLTIAHHSMTCLYRLISHSRFMSPLAMRYAVVNQLLDNKAKS